MAPAIRIDVSPILVAAMLLVALIKCGLLVVEVGKELKSDNCTRHDRPGPWIWFYFRMHGAVAGAAVSGVVWLLSPQWFAMTSSAIVATMIATWLLERGRGGGNAPPPDGEPGFRRPDEKPTKDPEIGFSDESEVA